MWRSAFSACSWREWLVVVVALALLLALVAPAFAVTADDLKPLASDDFADKATAVDTLMSAPDERVAAILAAMGSDQLFFTDETHFYIGDGTTYVDAITGAKAEPKADALKPVEINNRVRGKIDSAQSALALLSPDRGVRSKAIETLAGSPDPALAKLVDAAVAKETDPALKARLELVQAAFALKSDNPATRLAAIKALGRSENPQTRLLLLPFVQKNADGSFVEPDADTRAAAQTSLDAIDRSQKKGELLGALFSGVSLGSILLLVALGLAITYGLMGVINMAHGEFLMIGAYATYVVQGIFRSHFPGAENWYLVAAIPAAFLASAIIGAVLERTVIRFLYGRPLETLLATFGISLLLIQASRTIFGAQNVEVANPSWMSGGIEVLPNLILPWNRIYIIAFSAIVVALVWAILNLTRLGLFVRAVTQNRAMAGCVGVRTPRIDMLAFAIGAGIAGLGGVALSQISNVGPDMGQSYIIDSFMVVVLGGVGQLAGTIVGALGLGIVSKFLEPFSGAVLAKIIVLVFIILFIQRRPQGMFALKGRSAEA
ncbi:MAG: urea ABC transporter permease subunit UrtB [Proteobacteria bacterium]|nr:urea ABC transporter permease subunit UrtB [Pseudomonadota bacterium]